VFTCLFFESTREDNGGVWEGLLSIFLFFSFLELLVSFLKRFGFLINLLIFFALGILGKQAWIVGPGLPESLA
jgi:phosphate starvation-inducible membrane PsiE